MPYPFWWAARYDNLDPPFPWIVQLCQVKTFRTHNNRVSGCNFYVIWCIQCCLEIVHKIDFVNRRNRNEEMLVVSLIRHSTMCRSWRKRREWIECEEKCHFHIALSCKITRECFVQCNFRIHVHMNIQLVTFAVMDFAKTHLVLAILFVA